MTHVFDSLEVEDFIRSSTNGPWNYRASVAAASTVNENIATIANGGAIDGVTLATGDRVLLKNQTTGTQNGIYVIGAVAGQTFRAGDMFTGDAVSMNLLFVKEGAVNNTTSWFVSNASGADVVGTNALLFKRFGTFEDGTLPPNVALSTNLNANNFTITNLPDPTNPQDAANKQYVDAVSAGLDPKESSRMATTSAADLADWTRAGAGVGKTLTSPTLAALNIDGVAVVDTNRILVKDALQKVTTFTTVAGSSVVPNSYVQLQNGTTLYYFWMSLDNAGTDPMPVGTSLGGVSYANGDTDIQVATAIVSVVNGAFFTAANGGTANVTITSVLITDDVASVDSGTGFTAFATANDLSNNGIYTVSGVGGTIIFTRATDQDGSPNNEVSGGNYTFVEDTTAINPSSVNSNTGWVVAYDGIITPDVPPDDQILWVLFSASGTIIAGLGLSKVGNTLEVNVTDISTGISGDDVIVRSTSLSAQVLRSTGVDGAEAQWGALDLSSNNAVTGTLAGDHGGTGHNTYADDDLLVGTAPSSLSKLTSVVRSVLTTNDAGAVAWRNDAHLTSIVDPTQPGNINIATYTGAGVAAVNYLDFMSAISTDNPRISALGDDTNLGIDFLAKGTGAYNFREATGGVTKAGEIRLWDIDGSNWIGHQAQAIAINSTYSWPNAPGTTGLVLTSDTGGILSWVDPGTLSVSSRDFSLSLIKTTATKTTATIIAYFPWDASDLGGGTSFTVTFWHESVVASQDLIVELTNSSDVVLTGGTITISGAVGAQIASFTVASANFPGADDQLRLKIYKTAGGLASPSVTGAYLTWAA